MLTLRGADVHRPDSLSNTLRGRRFARFEALAASLPRPLRVLDVGGTVRFWELRGWAGRRDVRVTLLNLVEQPSEHENIRCVVGDAADLGRFADKSFDVVFSNSVIEHLPHAHLQASMAREIARVGRAYWVQTPHFWFPIEPHFHVPGWQWLPVRVRVWMLRHFRCGWSGPCPDRARAQSIVRGVRLLGRAEFEGLFPGSSIWTERFCGLPKSMVAYGGFGRARALPARALSRAA